MVRKQRRIVADHYRGRPRGVAPLSAPSPLVGEGWGGGWPHRDRPCGRASFARLALASARLAGTTRERGIRLDSLPVLIRLGFRKTFKDCTANRSLVKPHQT